MIDPAALAAAQAPQTSGAAATVPEPPTGTAAPEAPPATHDPRVADLEEEVDELTRRVATLEAAPKSSSSSSGIVAYVHHDIPSDEDVTWLGVIFERIPAGTDPRGEEYPERACVQWLHGGLSGPIDVTELQPV